MTGLTINLPAMATKGATPTPAVTASTNRTRNLRMVANKRKMGEIPPRTRLGEKVFLPMVKIAAAPKETARVLKAIAKKRANASAEVQLRYDAEQHRQRQNETEKRATFYPTWNSYEYKNKRQK